MFVSSFVIPRISQADVSIFRNPYSSMGSSGIVVCPPVWCIRSSCLLQQLRSAKMKFLQLDCKTFCINTKTGSAVLDVLNMPVYARKSGYGIHHS